MMRWNLEKAKRLLKFTTVLKENAEPNLEMFIHVTKTDLGQWGMSTCVTRDALFHLETTIRIQSDSLERWGWGSFSADREKYIEFCKRENHKTLLGYGLALSPEQLAAVDKEIAKLMSLTVPWDPPQIVKPKRPGIDKEEPMYAYKLKQEADATCINLPLQNSRRILS